jgi:CRP-like cAMP-binding protein
MIMPAENSLLAVLPEDVRGRLAESSRVKQLAHGEVLQRPGEDILTVYFPIDCLISITVTMAASQTAEAGLVGSREMVGLNAFMGGRETTQTEYICQFPGAAVRVPAEILLKEFDEDKGVRDVLLKYTQAYIAQLSQNVACNRLHTLEQRLPRWLLECRDRLQSDNFEITHEFISQMLGVRRSGITETASLLQQRGMIDSGRKSIRITDMPKLEAASCECFQVILKQYNDLLGQYSAKRTQS